MNLTVYDMVLLQEYFGRKKEPSEREKAAAQMLDGYLLELVESVQRLGPLPRDAR